MGDPHERDQAGAGELTDDLAVAGWAELGEIETSGFDTFRGRVATIVEKREAEIARRKRPITGLSEFPNLAEVLPFVHKEH